MLDSVLRQGQPLWIRFLLLAVLLTATACGPAPSPSPVPTQTQTSTPPPEPTATVTATRTESPTAPPTYTATPTMTPSPISVPTHTPTATATPTAEPTATPTLAPTDTPSPTATPTPTPTPTATRPTQPTPTPVPVSAGWRGEYFGNPDLEGQPALVRTDDDIGFDWGDGAPAPGLPAEGFSVRWLQVTTFEQGLYRFYATMDDGMRVYVDDELLIDEWRDRSEREVAASRQMSAGSHTLQVEYYDRSHGAVANLRWERDRSYTGWKGMYWANPDLLGQPLLMRDDSQIAFDWQMASPGVPIPSDHFSASWTRTTFLEEGIYRFRALADDGVRVWVDGRLILDAWSDHQRQEMTVDHVMAGAGAHTIQVAYYDNQFEARVQVSMDKVGEPWYAGWKGEYFANPYLVGSPVLVRNDDSLTFNWEWSAPAPSLPADNFSVRWTLEKEIEPGVYRFAFHVDDGVRFYVDDELVLDEWHPTWNETYEVEVTLSWKPKLVVEMYEESGDARIDASWTRIR